MPGLRTFGSIENGSLPPDVVRRRHEGFSPPHWRPEERTQHRGEHTGSPPSHCCSSQTAAFKRLAFYSPEEFSIERMSSFEVISSVSNENLGDS